jgi:hypothetical protein
MECDNIENLFLEYNTRLQRNAHDDPNPCAQPATPYGRLAL